jgi:hypothetical protein
MRWAVGVRDAEEILKIALRRRPTVQGHIRVDEGQVLALSRGERDFELSTFDLV